MTTTITERPKLIRAVLGLELVLMAAALIATATTHHPIDGGARDGIAATLAIALGAQNAIVRSLKVPDLTTTVLTMTLTGIAADIRSQPKGTVVRRLLAVATMLAGAAGGALLILHVSTTAALAVAVGIVAATFVALVLDKHEWK